MLVQTFVWIKLETKHNKKLLFLFCSNFVLNKSRNKKQSNKRKEITRKKNEEY